MYFWLILAMIFALLEAIAVSKNLQSFEYVVKPAVMICLFLWLFTSTDLQGRALWFGLGIAVSLLGDVLLIIPSEGTFLSGLVAFLFAHLFYITGLREGLGTLEAWSLILAIFIAVNSGALLRRIVGAMRVNGQKKLVFPVILYGIIISVMLYAAISTIYNPTWKMSASLSVSLGAFLFCASDALLAWNKFVSPIKNGRVLNMILYHLGQIGLVAGVVSQFT